jgi:hypothetical protein
MGQSIAQAASLNVLFAVILIPVPAAVLAALLCVQLRRYPKRQKRTHEMRASSAVDVEVSVTPVDATAEDASSPVMQSHIRSPARCPTRDQLLARTQPTPLPPRHGYPHPMWRRAIV